MPDIISCTATCTRVGCTNKTSWHAEAPTFENGKGVVRPQAYDPKWIMLSGSGEDFRGICPDCRTFTCDLDVRGQFTVIAIEPGVFDVQATGTNFGQLRGACRRWLLIPDKNGDIKTLAKIGSRIDERFDCTW